MWGRKKRKEGDAISEIPKKGEEGEEDQKTNEHQIPVLILR